MAQLVGQYTFEVDYKNYDSVREEKREAEWLKNLVAELRQKNKCEMVGKELHWPRADGYARYIIVAEKPFKLAHLNVGDGWQVENELIRGLRLKDAEVMLERSGKLRAMFAR